MQVKYTIVRPNTIIPFTDPTLPGFEDYLEAIATAGFEHHETMTMDSLTLVSVYTLSPDEFVAYNELLEQFKDVRAADRKRRESLGITAVKEIIE